MDQDEAILSVYPLKHGLVAAAREQWWSEKTCGLFCLQSNENLHQGRVLASPRRVDGSHWLELGSGDGNLKLFSIDDLHCPIRNFVLPSE